MKVLIFSLFLCFIVNAKAEYNETLARYFIWPMAAAAFAENPGLCVNDNFKKAEFKNKYTEACDLFKGDTCSGFSAVSHSDKAIILSFRGSQGALQVTDEVLSGLLDPPVSFVGGGGVNKYFIDAFQILWNAGMKNDFNSLKNQNPGYELWITGHSLGAAVASVAAATISATKLFPGDKIKLVTYGQPRVGNSDYAAAVDELIPYAYRVVHNHDLVPHLPPKNMLGYIHHKSEVWYPNNMAVGTEYIECDEDEGGKCSDSTLDLNPNDHDDYYDINTGFAKNGCPGYNPYH